MGIDMGKIITRCIRAEIRADCADVRAEVKSIEKHLEVLLPEMTSTQAKAKETAETLKTLAKAKETAETLKTLETLLETRSETLELSLIHI